MALHLQVDDGESVVVTVPPGVGGEVVVALGNRSGRLSITAPRSWQISRRTGDVAREGQDGRSVGGPEVGGGAAADSGRGSDLQG